MIDQNRHHVVPVRRVLYFVRLKYRGSKTWSTVKTSKEHGDNQFDFTTIDKKLQKLRTHMKICMTKKHHIQKENKIQRQFKVYVTNMPHKKNQAHHHRKSTYRYIETHESAVNGYHPKIYKTPQLDPLIHLRFQQKNMGASVLLGFQT